MLTFMGNGRVERGMSKVAETHSGVSRVLLRELILAGGLGPGSRLLIAGCGDGELAERLIPFGIQVTGVDESSDRVERAAAVIPQAEFQSGAVPRSQFDDQAGLFDSVLVLALSSLRGSVRSPAALRTIASLMSCIRPGGVFQFVSTGPGGGIPHEASCLVGQLSGFPGQVTAVPVIDRRAGSCPFPQSFVKLQLDDCRRSPDEWGALSDRPAGDSRKPCCRFCPAGVSHEDLTAA